MIAGASFRREAPAGVAGLGNTGNSSSGINREGRRRRLELREKVRRYADRTLVERIEWEPIDAFGGAKEQVVRMRPRDDRFLACGRRSRHAGGEVNVLFDADTGVAGYGGLQACGSVWACPVCAGKIQARRAEELGKVLRWARRELHTIALVTMTVRHNRRQSLDSVWDAISAGWAQVTSGSQWASESEERYLERLGKWEAARDLAERGLGRYPRGGRAGVIPQRRVGDQERYGVVGWARAVEVTVGDNGWHVHVHAVLVLEGSREDAARNAFAVGRRMWERWETGIAGVGDHNGEPFTALRDSGGLDIRLATAAEKRLAEYLSKDGLMDSPEHVTAAFDKAATSTAFEAAYSVGKGGRRGGRTPFQVLDAIDDSAFDLTESDPRHRRAARDLALWREWVRGSEGRRQITWSNGLRELAGLAADAQTDEEIANEDAGGELLFVLPSRTWHAVRDQPWLVLELLEHDGPAAVADYLHSRRLGFEFVPASADW